MFIDFWVIKVRPRIKHKHKHNREPFKARKSFLILFVNELSSVFRLVEPPINNPRSESLAGLGLGN